MPSPEFEAMRAMLVEGGSLDREDVHEAREVLDAMLGALPPAEGVATEPVEVAGRPAVWVRPPGAVGGRCVLYLHGGGFRVGSIAAYTPVATHFAAAVGAPFLVLDYRLAPEHAFPAAVDDAVRAVGELVGDGVAPRDLALMGDSAGGGLVLSTLLARRDRGEPQPAAAVCLSPWADLTLAADAYARCADADPVFGLEQARHARRDYLGDLDPGQPLASPALADLSGLAPVFVQASTDEVLADDATRVAEGIERAGGVVELDLWPGMTHVFQAMTPGVPEAEEAMRRCAAFLQRRWDEPASAT